MYCRFCGTENNNEYVFCKHCGKQLLTSIKDTDRKITPAVEQKETQRTDVVEEVEIKTDTRGFDSIEKDNILKPGRMIDHTKILMLSIIVLLGAIFIVLTVYLIKYLGYESIESIETSVNEEINRHSTSDQNLLNEEETEEEGGESDYEYDSYADFRDSKNDPNKKDQTSVYMTGTEVIDHFDDEGQEKTTADKDQSFISDNESDVDGYILPDSSEQLITAHELENLSEDECRIARNEIYARHGRRFKDKDLQDYFDKQKWYEGYIEPNDFSESVLNKTEIENIRIITEYEKDMGYR